MAQQTETFIFNVNDTSSEPGEQLPISSNDFSSLVVNNTSGQTISYSTDGGATWNSLANGGSLSYGYGLKSKYLFRKTSASWASLSVTVKHPGTEAASLLYAENGNTALAGPDGKAFGTILTSGIPMVLQSSGSVGNNGALTLTTAVPYAYPACYMYFPAGAIFAGSSAGWYFVSMTTTTDGTIYNNTYTSGKPVAPTVPVAFATTGPGAYTQITGGAITAIGLVIPGGALGRSGKLTITKMGVCINNANGKISETFMGGSAFASYTFNAVNMFRTVDLISNTCNSEAINIGNYYANFGASANDVFRRTVNTSVDQLLALTLRINTATDFIALESVSVELVYGG